MTDREQPIARAAEILGKSSRTVLRWIQSGKLPARKLDGQWYVDLSGVMPSERPAPADVMSEKDAELSDLGGEVSLLRSQLTEKNGEVSVLKGEVSMLRSQLTERDGGVSDLRGEVSLLRSQLIEKDGEVSDLRKGIGLLRSQLTEKDRQVVELHTLLGKAQKAPPNPGKRRWWMFWKR